MAHLSPQARPGFQPWMHLQVPGGSFKQTISYKIQPFQLCRVDLPSSIKLQAVSKALSYLGAPYNDLFIPNNVTPDGERTFYCSELITDVYSEMDMHFPEHTLQFGSGDTLKYWEKFYKERGRQVRHF